MLSPLAVHTSMRKGKCVRVFSVVCVFNATSPILPRVSPPLRGTAQQNEARGGNQEKRKQATPHSGSAPLKANVDAASSFKAFVKLNKFVSRYLVDVTSSRNLSYLFVTQ